MNINSVDKTLSIIPPSKMAELLGFTYRAIVKYKPLKYFPSDWHGRIIGYTNNQVTRDELENDLYRYKLDIIPEVLQKDIAKFLNGVGKTPTNNKAS